MPAGIHTFLSVDGALDDPQSDPNASLGGAKSTTTYGLESTLTSAMTALATITDTVQVEPAAAPSPDSNTPLANSGSYVSSANLLHWFRPGVVRAADMGINYGSSSIAVEPNTNMSSSDLTAQQPGQFNQARESLDFGGTNTVFGSISGGITAGITNTWSVGIWFRPTSTAGTATMFRLQTGTSAGTANLNAIQIHRSGTELRVRVVDDTTSADQKEREFTGVLALNTWSFVVVTWDGSTLTTYLDGSALVPSSTPEDDSITMGDSATRRFAIGAINPTNFPSEEFIGQIHSVMVWTNELTAAEVLELDGFGDGVAPAALDHSGSYMVFEDGTNENDIHQISTHDNSTGEMTILPPADNLALISAAYTLYTPNALFDSVNALECANGHADHRCLYIRNETGSAMNTLRMYVEVLESSSTQLSVALSDRNSIGSGTVPVSADELVDPDIRTIVGQSFASEIQVFRQPRDYSQALETPFGTLNLANNTHTALWLRREISQLTRRFDSAGWVFVLEDTLGTIKKVPVVWDQVGFTPDLTLTFDRIPRTFGGARLTGKLVDDDFDTPVEGIPLSFQILVGPGSLSLPTPPFDTDEDGEFLVQYVGPEDDAQAGASLQVEVSFGGDA